MYIKGFVDIASLTMNICGDPSNLIYRFEESARAKPNADTNSVLLNLLVQDYACPKGVSPVYAPTSAGRLLEVCHAEDIGIGLCTDYQTGFLSYMMFIGSQAKKPVFCGDLRIIDSAIQLLNMKVREKASLADEPAVKVMATGLMEKLPCAP